MTTTTARLRGTIAAGLLVGGTALLAACGTQPVVSAPRCAEAGADIACTAQGPVRGSVENGTLAFKGIPYAQPPVGGLRWRAPQPPLAWQGVRNANQFGPVCPQLAGTEVVGNEDCLTVNVWRPEVASPALLPVMVFLQGGGNHSLSGQGTAAFGGVQYNGQLLTGQGVVFVSFNHRIGALGFLAHPALGAERAEKVSGNYGNLDQVAVLLWLQANVAAFGGDPKRIMLFGTSAGGGSICALMTAPAARGLFHGAAMQSSVPTGCTLPTLADAENGTGRRVVQALRCGGAETAACLRARSALEVVQAVPGTFGVLPRVYGPNVDGVLFPQQPFAAIEKGTHSHMPVIIGNTTDETMTWAGLLGSVSDSPTLDLALGRVFGREAVPRIRAEYPLAGFPVVRDALVSVTTDAFFTCPSRRVARALARTQKEPVVRYVFSQALENDPALPAQRAVHTIEHVFFFPWSGTYRPTVADQVLQQQMLSLWTRFARTGSLPPTEWPAATASSDVSLLLGPDGGMRAANADAKCDFWETVVLPRPHL